MTNKYQFYLKPLVFIASLFPIISLIIFGYRGELGANPIEHVTRSTGTWTLIFILITLSITPARKILNIPWLIKIRRMLGLFTFFYALLHFTTYIWLDQFFDFHSIYKDIIKHPYITVGFSAFLLLIPLAITSSNFMIKKMGWKKWQQLHKLIYLIAILGVIHYWWLVKKDITEPLIYAILLAILLGYRLVTMSKKKTN